MLPRKLKVAEIVFEGSRLRFLRLLLAEQRGLSIQEGGPRSQRRRCRLHWRGRL